MTKLKNRMTTGNVKDNQQEERKWYVAYVRMFHERKTAEKLAAMGIESFVPVREEIHQWSQRKKKVMRVLIPQMIFIHATQKERLREEGKISPKEAVHRKALLRKRWR